MFNVFEKFEEFIIPYSLIHSQRGLEVGNNFASAMRLHMIASGPFGQSRVIPLSFVVLIETRSFVDTLYLLTDQYSNSKYLMKELLALSLSLSLLWVWQVCHRVMIPKFVY